MFHAAIGKVVNYHNCLIFEAVEVAQMTATPFSRIYCQFLTRKGLARSISVHHGRASGN
jgi:hypothetical protein